MPLEPQRNSSLLSQGHLNSGVQCRRYSTRVPLPRDRQFREKYPVRTRTSFLLARNLPGGPQSAQLELRIARPCPCRPQPDKCAGTRQPQWQLPVSAPSLVAYWSGPSRRPLPTEMRPRSVLCRLLGRQMPRHASNSLESRQLWLQSSRFLHRSREVAAVHANSLWCPAQPCPYHHLFALEPTQVHSRRCREKTQKDFGKSRSLGPSVSRPRDSVPVPVVAPLVADWPKGRRLSFLLR